MAVKVIFKKEDGPITLEVTSGYSTLGEFLLLYKEINQPDNYQTFGKDPKLIHDTQPDIFCIPIDVDRISGFRIYILGKYSPAPGHTQIKVNYNFYQNGKKLKVDPKNGNKIEETSDNSFYRITHRFEFTPDNN